MAQFIFWMPWTAYVAVVTFGSMLKPISELVDDNDPGWPVVQEWISGGTRPIAVLPTDRVDGEAALLGLQVTSRSPLGAVCLETGGLLVDHGWVRVLGAKSEAMGRGILEWNRCDAEGNPTRLPGAFLIADDAMGGFFALNGTAFPAAGITVHYFAPDRLEWEDLGLGYSQFLVWLFSGDVERFYERWPGWETETARLPGNQAFNFSPPLFTERQEIQHRNRRPCPLAELWELYVEEIPRQLGLSSPLR